MSETKTKTKTRTIDLFRAVDDAADRFESLCRDIDPVLALHFRNSVNTMLAMATLTGAVAGPEASIVAEAMRALVFAADSMPDPSPAPAPKLEPLEPLEPVTVWPVAVAVAGPDDPQ